WREIVGKALNGARIRELRELSGRRFEGAKRVREPGSPPPAWWPAAWPVAIQDVFVPGTTVDVDIYVQRAREWARADARHTQRGKPCLSDAPCGAARRLLPASTNGNLPRFLPPLRGFQCDLEHTVFEG